MFVKGSSNEDLKGSAVLYKEVIFDVQSILKPVGSSMNQSILHNYLLTTPVSVSVVSSCETLPDQQFCVGSGWVENEFLTRYFVER